MSRSDHRTGTDATALERAAERLEATEVIDVARAALECAGEAVGRRFGRDAAVAAALCVATRRGGRREVDPEAVAERLGLAPSRVARAVDLCEGKVSPPAPEAEIRSLRRSVVAACELLAAIENGRSNAPRLAGAPFDGLDPALASLADRPLERVDAAELAAHRRRLSADLEMARLGVELYARVHGGASGPRR